MSSTEADLPAAGDSAAAARGEPSRELLRGLATVDRRLRLRRGLAVLVWLLPASCLWLLSIWLLRTAAGDGSLASLWPSWAGGAVLLAVALREAASLGRDLPAAARAVDRAGNLHDAVATALEMTAGPRAERAWSSWAALVVERGAAGLHDTGARQAAPRLVPRGAAASAIASAALLLPVALPNSFVGEALASAVGGTGTESAPRGLQAAALPAEEPVPRPPGSLPFDARLGVSPFPILRLREDDGPESERRRNAEDSAERVAGSLGEGADAEASRAEVSSEEAGEPAASGHAGEQNAETGSDLMRELDTGSGEGGVPGDGPHVEAGEDEPNVPGMRSEGDSAAADADAAASEDGSQRMKDGEDAESGTAAAVGEALGSEAPGSEAPGSEAPGSEAPGSETPGSEAPRKSGAQPEGGAAGVGAGSQEEMVDPFGDLPPPALSLEQALETAMIESREEIDRRPLTTTSATRFRAAEVALRGAGANAFATGPGGATAASGALPPPRHPIAWRHRAAARRYLASLEDDSRESGK